LLNGNLTPGALRHERAGRDAMTTPSDDVAPGQESQTFSRAASPARRDEEQAPISLAQEINERRARVENAELLRNLRSL
jgi:hypothetical protein